MVTTDHTQRRSAARDHAARFPGLDWAPRSAAAALGSLERVAEELHREGDARAVFPAVYAVITRRVARDLAAPGGGGFLEPAWISRLAGRFCERYLETLRVSLDGEPQDAGAWGSAYAAARAWATIPAQHAFLGLSAHINLDLALGIHATILEQGLQGDERALARCKHDHDRVNTLLDEAFPETLRILAVDHGCPASALARRHTFRFSRALTMRLLTTWRARVWADVRALLAAPGEAARRRIQARIEARSAWIGWVVATPSLLAQRAFPREIALLDLDDAEAPPVSQIRPARPARFATTAASSAGSIGFGR